MFSRESRRSNLSFIISRSFERWTKYQTSDNHVEYQTLTRQQFSSKDMNMNNWVIGGNLYTLAYIIYYRYMKWQDCTNLELYLWNFDKMIFIAFIMDFLWNAFIFQSYQFTYLINCWSRSYVNDLSTIKLNYEFSWNKNIWHRV